MIHHFAVFADKAKTRTLCVCLNGEIAVWNKHQFHHISMLGLTANLSLPHFGRCPPSSNPLFFVIFLMYAMKAALFLWFWERDLFKMIRHFAVFVLSGNSRTLCVWFKVEIVVLSIQSNFSISHYLDWRQTDVSPHIGHYPLSSNPSLSVIFGGIYHESCVFLWFWKRGLFKIIHRFAVFVLSENSRNLCVWLEISAYDSKLKSRFRVQNAASTYHQENLNGRATNFYKIW